MVALGEKLCRKDTRPRDGRRSRKGRFGRYSNSSAASESSVISVAGNYPNGGLTGNIPNGTTDYVWQGWQTMEERNPFGGSGSTDTPIRQYVWGTYIDECIQLMLLVLIGPEELSDGPYYPLQDLLYRTVALTDFSGAVAEAYDSDPYGKTLIFSAPDTTGNWWGDAAVQSNYGANEIIYCGYRFDPETELYYVRNRTYNPALGRWIQRDPIGYPGGINLYGYVGGRVDGIADPAGLAQWHPAQRGFWHTGITPDVQIQQGGIPDYRLFNAAVNKISDFRQRPGESKKACIARLAKLYDRATMYMDETYQEAVQAEADSLYQEGVLDQLSQAERQAMITAALSIVPTLGEAGAAGASRIFFPPIGGIIGGGMQIGGLGVITGYNVTQAIHDSSVKMPKQFLRAFGLFLAMQGRLNSSLAVAMEKCKCLPS